MIRLNNISLSFGSQAIFDEISCGISPKARIGLVGRNGSGKSTLLKTIAGDFILDDGTISLGGTKIAYLPQDIVLLSEKTILEEACSAFAHLEPEELQAKVIEVKKMLMGLGFQIEKHNQPVTQLSTGWKMRLVLAKLLLQKADFYLFDEPTNHLDIFAQEWFLKFLQNSEFGFLLVCHERAFLNKACNEILELERGKATLYKGSYEVYIKQKAEQLERLRSAQALQEKEIERMKDNIQKFRAKASKAAFAQSLIKKLDKMEIIEVPQEDTSRISIHFRPVQRAAKNVLCVENVKKTFNETDLFKNANFCIERDMKVALVAANGVGKTTLLRIITKEYPLEQGSIEFGDNVTYAIFKQNQHESLNPSNTIWEEVFNNSGKRTESELRRMLGSFLFSGETVEKKTSVLSGGEKNRLCMVKTFLEDNNFLILDEPTNHLDIPAKDILLKALKAYPGTLLFVSHDKDFVNNLATHILELTPQGTYLYKGNFDEFLEQKKYREERSSKSREKEVSAVAEPSNQTALNNPQRYELQKKGRRLEEKIEKLEQKQEFLCKKLEKHPHGTGEYRITFAELTATQQALDAATQEWESLLAELQ